MARIENPGSKIAGAAGGVRKEEGWKKTNGALCVCEEVTGHVVDHEADAPAYYSVLARGW